MKNTKPIFILLLIGLICFHSNVQGQNVYEKTTEQLLNKYYNGLNSIIVNPSTREGTTEELKTIFRDASQSIVYNDMNLLEDKSVSKQTNLEEYLRRISYFATKSENEKVTFTIDYYSEYGSYNESRQYVDYLNRYAIVSTIDVNKTIKYGYTWFRRRDHITLIDGQFEKIESFKREISTTTKTSSIEWPWEIDFDSRVMGFSMGYVQKKVDFYYNDDSKETTDLAWNYEPNAFTNGLRLGLHFQPCFSWGLGLYTGFFFEYYYSHTPSSNKATTEEGLLADAYTSFSEKAISVPLHLYFRVPFSEEFALSFHGGINADYLFGATYKDSDGIWMTYTPSYGTDVRYEHFNLEYAFGAGIQYEWALIEATWFNGITKNEKFATSNYTKALLTGFSINFSILPDLK